MSDLASKEEFERAHGGDKEKPPKPKVPLQDVRSPKKPASPGMTGDEVRDRLYPKKDTKATKTPAERRNPTKPKSSKRKFDPTKLGPVGGVFTREGVEANLSYNLKAPAIEFPLAGPVVGLVEPSLSVTTSAQGKYDGSWEVLLRGEGKAGLGLGLGASKIAQAYVKGEPAITLNAGVVGTPDGAWKVRGELKVAGAMQIGLRGMNNFFDVQFATSAVDFGSIEFGTIAADAKGKVSMTPLTFKPSTGWEPLLKDLEAAKQLLDAAGSNSQKALDGIGSLTIRGVGEVEKLRKRLFGG